MQENTPRLNAEKSAPARSHTSLIARPVRHFVILIGICFFVLIGLQRFTDYRSTERIAEMSARNGARLLHEHADRTFEGAELLLQSVVHSLTDMQHGEPPSAEAIHAMLVERTGHLPQVNRIVILDADGILQYDSTTTSPQAIDASGRDYFRQHRAGAVDRLTITPPLRALDTGEWFIGLTYSIRDRAGQFAGVAVALVEPRYFSAFYHTMDMGPHGALALTTADGRVIAAVSAAAPPDAEFVNQSLAACLALFADNSNPTALPVSDCMLDGTRRIIAQRTTRYGFNILVGGATLDIILAWLPSLFSALLLILSIVALLTGFAILRTQQLQQYEALTNAIQASEARFRELFDHAPVGYHELDQQGRIQRVNQTELSMLGYQAEEMLGRPVWEFVVEQEDERRAFFARLADNSETMSTRERTMRRKDGSGMPAILQARHTYDAARRVNGLRVTVQDITDYRRAQAELHREEQEKAIILSNMAEEVVYYDRGQHVLWTNRSMGTLMAELTPAGAPGPRCQELFQERHGPCDACPVQRAMETGESQEEEIAISHGRYVLSRTQPVRASDGEIIGAVEIVLDITARKRAEEALLRRDQLLRGAAEATSHLLTAPDIRAGIHFALETLGKATDVDRAYIFENGVDPETGQLQASQRFEWARRFELVQITNPELQNVPYDPAMTRWKEAFLAGRPIVGLVRDFPAGERAILAPQGILSILAMPITLEGRLWGFLGLDDCARERSWSDAEIAILASAATSIGAAFTRERAAERLRASKEKLRAIFESISEGIVVTDLSGNIEEVNQVILQMTGTQRREELIGRNVFEFFTPADLPRARQNFAILLAEGQSLGAEYRLIKDLNRTIEAEITAALLRDENGQATSMVAVVRDITERRRIEAELRNAQKLEAVGVLAGGIAHDFNNILTAILGNISLARMTAGHASNITQDLQAAERACLRARDLTHQLLTFSRGGAPIRQSASIGELVRETAIFTLRGSKSRCRFDIPNDLWPAEIDVGQISQVIQNLVINADQAMPAGGIIEITARNAAGVEATGALPAGQRYVHIAVRDHGVGIPTENMPHIFDPYFTTKESGRGLGLATSYSIIKQHEGHLTLESQVGVGTTFHIYLPAADKGPAASSEIGDRATSQHGRILVMEDEEAVREVVLGILTHLGFQPRAVSDGKEMLRLYREMRDAGAPFDAVIMDVTIPGGMGGVEAIGELLKLDPQARVIVSSGYANAPVMAEYTRYGFAGVVVKPYRVEELQRVLNAVLANT